MSRVAHEPDRAELEAAHCWEADDHVPGDPAMTAFRRSTRLHHARWREARGMPVGSQPIGAPPRNGTARPVGSRVPLAFGRETGATFLTPAARAAAEHRLGRVEAHQSVDQQRLWADLLSSQALAFNLFGDLATDVDRADRAVHTWWPDVPGRVTEVRFVHSPGRLDPSYLNSLRQFDAVFVLDLGDGDLGAIAVDTKYHERSKAETPKPENMARNLEVAARSGVFAPHPPDAFRRSDLAETWLEHLLLLSMLQHPGDRWRWGRYVVVHPAANVHATDLADRYRPYLAEPSSFASLMLEALLASGTLPRPVATEVRRRYLPG